MKSYLIRFINLIFGLFLFAIGIVMTMKANIGFSPWDVLHSGLSEKTGISLGTVSILLGVLICIVVAVVGEKIGVGTILNMVLIGVFINILMEVDFIPTRYNLMIELVVLILGLFVISLGSYFYIKSGFGAGPRDYLMVVIRRNTQWPVGVSRVLVEGAAVLVGWALGGSIGIGTVIAAFGISFCIQIVFSWLKFESTTVNHETLRVTYQNVRDLLGKRNA